MASRLNADIQKPRIVEAFYHTLVEEGFEGASIAKVAARLDMKPTLILHYFGNKENLTIASVDFTLEIYDRLLSQFKARTEAPEERLMALLRTFWSKAYFETIHIAAAQSVIGASFRNEAIKKKVEALYRRLKTDLVGYLEEFRQAGIINVSDTERMAEILITMAEGARHFRHFHVKSEDMAAYTEHMIMAALSLLKNPYVQNDDTETNHLQGKANNKTQSKQQMIAVKDII